MKKHFLMIVLLMFILIGCNDSDNEMADTVGTITFGAGSLEEGITDVKTSFTEEDTIILEVELLEPFDSDDLKFVVLEELEDGTKSVYSAWHDSVDPQEQHLIYLFQGENSFATFEPDEYIVKMYVDEIDKVAEGSFKVK